VIAGARAASGRLGAWSRPLYVEFVWRADVAAFLRRALPLVSGRSNPSRASSQTCRWCRVGTARNRFPETSRRARARKPSPLTWRGPGPRETPGISGM